MDQEVKMDQEAKMDQEVKMYQEAKMYQEVISKTNVTLIPLFAHGAEVGR